MKYQVFTNTLQNRCGVGKKVASVLSLIVLLCSASYAADKTVKSKIDKVTVFLQGAQVYRSGTFEIPRGVSDIVFEGVSARIDANSLQVNGRGNFTILDVHHNVRYIAPEAVPVPEVPQSVIQKIKVLEDTLVWVGFELADFKARREVLGLEKNLLMASGMIKGQGSVNDSILFLDEVLHYFRKQLNEINQELASINREEHRVLLRKRGIDNQLQDMRNYNAHLPKVSARAAESIQQVIITVQSEHATSGKLTVNYMVSNAGWTPAYDLRAENTETPVKLTYKARVHQNTGVNWEGVDLRLSTNNTNGRMNRPQLPAWYLSYFQAGQAMLNEVTIAGAKNKKLRLFSGMAKDGANDKEQEKLQSDFDLMAPAANSANYTAMVQTMIDVEFDIKLPYNINSDGKNHMVAIQTKEIPSSYNHIIVPKTDKRAFLVAQITDWEKLQLLPAAASVYFEGSYIGKTMLNPETFSDTLELALGTDRNLVVERKKLKEEEKPKLIGSTVVKTLSYQIIVKNKRSNKINLIIEDQIPLSNDEEIEVNLTQKGKAVHNESTGLLTWKFYMESLATRKLNYSYTIEYDSAKSLLGQL